MMKFFIKYEDIQIINESETIHFPKYTSQLINWANQNAQATRPKVVGQLSELFPDYQKHSHKITISDWRSWYTKRFPNAIETATSKIFDQMEKLKSAINLIDKDMIHKWVEDLVITKTFNGFHVQKAILVKIAEKKECPWRFAKPEEESQGIDGYIGEFPYSIKPDTYKTMNRLSEEIKVKMVFYKKEKTGLLVELED